MQRFFEQALYNIEIKMLMKFDILPRIKTVKDVKSSYEFIRRESGPGWSMTENYENHYKHFYAANKKIDDLIELYVNQFKK